MKNKNNLAQKIYCLCFPVFLMLPLMFVNIDEEAISEQENRPLTQFPELFVYDDLNMNYSVAMDNYLNDRIGFRDQLIMANALIQYNVFGRMENGDRYRLGPDGEFNIIEEGVVETYQHLNLYSEAEVDNIVNSFQTVDDYLEDKNIDFYYMMCYDKETIYPEYFPDSVIQYGDISRTDQIINGLTDHSSVTVVPVKEKFISQKSNYELYSKYGDPVHWTWRGAFYGYSLLMNTINQNKSGNIYPVLKEEDFDISLTDQGMSFYFGVSRENISEEFVLKNTSNVLCSNASDYYPSFAGYNTYYHTNEKVDNDTRCLVICNSFFINYLRDMISESFSETMFVWGGIDPNIDKWIEDYKPDIVIYESAERYESFENIVETADSIE
ncbi:MAG: hypothetical protein K6G87_17485 [Butyrivibrio sp.]|uniref:hypothetical protein n=1 Tax=Butyrivibrio sp. TaxID=28121 RepID=UPI0025F0E150|nr:hypothetical protein [Butyrivibrio sp.]MCR5773020.1 hypothetical protein [Butyrivibrio sp.]